jgi:2-polyprenyl-3-methyl-5-hydroxy-6-metoxy-1,4-benzoquinol methylase
MNCRACHTELTSVFIDLGATPVSNSFLTLEQLTAPEIYYPLKVFTCSNCFLVQLDEYKKATEIFSDDYVYFSSYSRTWLEHAKNYVHKIVQRKALNSQSLVVEIASNDGYLLQYFKEINIPVLGIEPSGSVAKAAQEKGVETLIAFFGATLAQKLVAENKQADLLVGNNVLAHVPDINDFVKGLQILLKPDGMVTLEFPHLLNLINEIQFDTIYHEHFSYLSFISVQRIFESQGLELFDVEALSTHGGSIRIYGQHPGVRPISTAVMELITKETAAGMKEMDYYQGFQQKVNLLKYDLLRFLIAQKMAGKRVAGYGAAAKGNTFLNYCGIKPDLLAMVADASPAKQQKYLPGSHIPVVSENELRDYKPDFVLILPWNIKTEIMEQLAYIRTWGGKFVIAIPRLQVL